MGEGCFIACLFAATFPDRVSALVLYNGSAAIGRTEDTPWSWDDQQVEQANEHRLRAWGTRELAEEMIRDDAPSVLGDERELEWLVRYMRLSAGPGTIRAEWRNFAAWDIRDVLPAIRVPTLVVQRIEFPSLNIEDGRYLASRIPDARLVQLPGRTIHRSAGTPKRFWMRLSDSSPARGGLSKPTGSSPPCCSRTSSTRRGEPSSWVTRGGRSCIAEHHERIREELRLFRGREIDTAGDGFLATFDGPARAVRCAEAVVRAVQPLGIEIRAGVHTGEVELAGDGIRGIAVHIGARIGALAGPSEVLVSQTVKDLVAGYGLTFEDAGEHELKGVPDRWHLYRVVA